MLHYAYSRKLPVQIVITDGKEAVISEKDMSAHFGQTLLVGYSDVIQAAVRSHLHSFSLLPQTHRPRLKQNTAISGCPAMFVVCNPGCRTSASLMLLRCRKIVAEACKPP